MRELASRVDTHRAPKESPSIRRRLCHVLAHLNLTATMTPISMWTINMTVFIRHQRQKRQYSIDLPEFAITDKLARLAARIPYCFRTEVTSLHRKHLAFVTCFDNQSNRLNAASSRNFPAILFAKYVLNQKLFGKP